MNKPTQISTGTFLAFGAFALLPMHGLAQTASHAGTQLDLTDWRTTSVAKPFDSDGDDVIGTLGYHLFGAAGENTTPAAGANGPLASLPGYITVTRNSGSELQFGYALIDNPVDNDPATIVSGTTSGSAGVQNIATIDFSAGVPASLTMTLMGDNLDGVFNTSYEVRASDGTTVLTSTSGSNSNQQPDWQFVTLEGLSDGSSVQIWSASGSFPTLGGITFDEIVTLTVVDDSATTELLTFVDVPVLDNDNPTGTVTLVEVVDDPASGTAAVQPDNSIRYTHTTGAPSSDSFTYRLTDDNGLSALATVTITLTAPPSPLVVGTEIGIDFGPTAPTNNFNQAAATSAYGSIAAGSVIDTSNVVVAGVGFTYAGNLTPFSNNDANEGQAGQPTVFDSSNLTDWLGMSGEPDTGVMTLTFTGLDDALTYDLTLGAAFTNNLPDTSWQVDGQSATTDADVVGSSYVSFSGLSTDGSGNLVITGTGTAPRPDIPVIAALQLTAAAGGGTSAFEEWATGGESFEGDANGDGVQDGIAFLLGAATPSTDVSGLLPTLIESGGDLIITFNCLPVADRGDAELRVQHSSDLGDSDPWLATVDQVPDADDPAADNGVTFVVDTISAAPLNKVTATINSSEASGGRLFGRLMGTELP